MSETAILIIVGIVLFLVFVWMIVFFRKARDVTSGRNVEKARRSVAITGAPTSRSTPRTTAERPLTSMSAPMRLSSGTCI